jgi:hypothetical protein
LRFDSSSTSYLSRTPSVASNRKTWTWSGWVKRSVLDSATFDTFFACRIDGGNYTGLIGYRNSANDIGLVDYSGGVSRISVVTTQVFRDTSAWFHLLCAVDTTAATSTDRVKIYVNGVLVTALSSSTYPSQNIDTNINTTNSHRIGEYAGYYSNSYLANVQLIDGQQLTPSSFTEVSATTGQLIPKAYTGTYGQVSVAAATGGLPIWNTTDTYGAAKGSGTRTDASSSSIVLALPMDGTNGGTSFGDQSATIKGSGSAKTVTVNGNTNTSTAQSKFYGSSAYFDGAGDYLTLGSSADFAFGTGDFTIEAFVYRPSGGGLQIFDHLMGTGNFTIFSYSNQAITVYSNAAYSSGVNPGNDRWFHLAVVRSSGVLSFFIDGVKAANTYSFTLNMTTAGVNIGSSQYSEYGTQYLQDLRVYKGLAKYTTNFSPVTISNSFYLQFADNSSNTASTLGKDTSGNSNNWTPNNLSVTAGAGNDSLVDTPTSYGTDTGVGGEVRGNYATLNPLSKSSVHTLSDGNLTITGISPYGSTFATIGMSSGKWYWEQTLAATTGTNDIQIGMGNKDTDALNYPGATSRSYGFSSGNLKWNNGGATAYTTSWTSGDVIGLAFNADTGSLTLYKNGASLGVAFSSIPADTYFPIAGAYNSSSVSYLNFGQRAFAYTAPSGFKALCDTNLGAPVVAKPNTLMDVKLWTGTGATQSITGVGFNPDFLWIKSRSGSGYNHHVYDSVRGIDKFLRTNATQSEFTVSPLDQVTSLNADGFTLGSDSASPGALEVNELNQTYVGWLWDAGTSTVSNTQGSITSQVRANPTAGFSIVTYTGNGTSGATVGHGLGVAPSMMIIKKRSSTGRWEVYLKVLGPTLYLEMDVTNGAGGPYSGLWNNTDPTSTVFSIGNDSGVNSSGGTYVAYCFSSVVGYSSFGSYVGNGSSDGVFVYTGHRPRWILLKATSIANESWIIIDTARSTYNVVDAFLRADTSGAEFSSSLRYVDILSNGFKLRASGTEVNGSGTTYVYSSFAESPFQYARAR